MDRNCSISYMCIIALYLFRGNRLGDESKSIFNNKLKFADSSTCNMNENLNRQSVWLVLS